MPPYRHNAQPMRLMVSPMPWRGEQRREQDERAEQGEVQDRAS